MKTYADVVLVSWGDFDKKQLQKECETWWIKWPFSEHINAKELYVKKLSRKPCGLDKACRITGLKFEGTHHRGIDDAKMVAKIFKILMTEEYKKFINVVK